MLAGEISRPCVVNDSISLKIRRVQISCNAPWVHERTRRVSENGGRAFEDMSFVKVYICDVIVVSKNMTEHLD